MLVTNFWLESLHRNRKTYLTQHDLADRRGYYLFCFLGLIVATLFLYLTLCVA